MPREGRVEKKSEMEKSDESWGQFVFTSVMTG